MSKYPNLARNSGPHRTANALTLIALKGTREELDRGEELIESLTTEELRMTLAALATQAANHCCRAHGGNNKAAIKTMKRMTLLLAALPAGD